MKKRLHVWVYGIVKGVFFRSQTKEQADRLGLKGFVRNMEDGVEAVFEGDTQVLREMLEFFKKGPRYSRVQKIDSKEENYTGEFKDFRILYL
jgi:acylphosphatase